MFSTADSEDTSQVTSLEGASFSSRDVEETSEDTQLAKQRSKVREFTMNMLVKELVFFIALALTTYGAINNVPPKISKHPQAVKFFKSNLVTDWYRGQLSHALDRINVADISFVMYYAPWDAESQFVRGEFEKAAQILNDRIHFSAINCWNPGSECRLQHSKIPSWPILMVYTVTSRGVLYKGPRDAHSMVNFLELIMKPLERVSSTEDLVNLLSICDVVAVAYTSVTDTSKYYNVWYNVALKAREFDTLGEICFAVVTSVDTSVDLGVTSFPNARLMSWNDTKEYIVDEDTRQWNDSSLLLWVMENFAQPVARVIPMWKKSFSFDKYVDGNPMLILFTPLNPLYEQLPNYALLREVAMEYYNCKHNETFQWTTELVKLQQVQRLLYQQKDYMKFCQEFKYKKPVRKPNKLYKKGVISHNNKYPWNNSTHKNQKNDNDFLDFLLKQGVELTKLIGSGSEDLLYTIGLWKECSSKILPAEKSFYVNYDQCQTLEDNLSYEDDIDLHGDVETTMLPFEDDPLSPENLIQDNVKHFCKLTKFAYKYHPPVSPAAVHNANITHIQGLSCANNVSLYMLAIDSVNNHHFAEALGIDITKKKDMTAAVILDNKHESQYVLSEEYSAKSIRDFIYNFTMKRLKRSLRTHVSDAMHTHYFNTSSERTGSSVVDGDVRIIELTTKTFKKVVHTPGMLTIIAVCGGPCGAHTTRSVVEATRFLRACDLRVRAARLDARRHELPWTYTAHAHPAVLVCYLDGARELETRVYPTRARVTAGGVAALALRAMSAPGAARVRLVLCARCQALSEKKSCLKDVKEHITSMLGSNLKYWRRTEDRDLRDAIFRRLQHLHTVSVYSSLLHIDDLNGNNQKQISLLDSLSVLSNNWDIDLSSLTKRERMTSRS